MRIRHAFFALLAVLTVVGPTLAQPTEPAAIPAPRRVSDKEYATLNMRTNLGSFRLINGEGQVAFDFRGTVLLSGYEGDPPIISGNVRKEYERHGRTLYFGRGRMILQGRWQAVQWFGSDLRFFRWTGHGIARITGEFDADGNTGEYWYEDPNEKQYWFAQSITITVPPIRPGSTAVPRPGSRTGGG